MNRTVAVAIAFAATAAMVGPLSAAHATFPGENGPILFRHVDPETGLGVPLLRALPDGTQVTAINKRPGFFSDWRADGRRIAFDFFQSDGDEQIATVKPDGSDLRVITSGTGIHEIPSWSPSGRRIVFGYSPVRPDAPDFETRLWTMRADGSDARPLPMRRPGFDVEPRYSPDGRWIAFGRLRPPRKNRELQTAIFIVKARGGRARRLTRWADYPDQPSPKDAYPEHPTWSPDSRWIVFDLGPNGTIQAIRPNGRDRHTILAATEGFGAHKPWYSPDGTRLLFMCETQGTRPEPPEGHNEDICVADADGANIVNITNTPDVFENWPSWGPAPR